jgi:predicted nucleic acid-binding protein
LAVVGLLDVNVLVALLIAEHQHHDAAIEWFAAEGHQG